MQNTHAPALSSQQSLQKEIKNTKTAVGDNSDSEIPLFYYT
jgi:hypothetical protein